MFDLRGMKFNSIFEKFNRLSPWLAPKDSYLKKRQKLYYDPTLKYKKSSTFKRHKLIPKVFMNNTADQGAAPQVWWNKPMNQQIAIF